MCINTVDYIENVITESCLMEKGLANTLIMTARS